MSSSSSTESPKGGDHHVSEPINEELRYLYVSNVKVSNFVSVKLLDKSNYTLWMEQMLCLLDSQNLRGFVDATVVPPEIKSFTIRQQYKSLVKGWIFRSLNEDMLKRVINSGGPQEIWSALETICHPKEAPTGSTGSSSTELPKAGDHVSEPINEEVLRYLYASNVNVSNFVSVSPLTKRNNYTIWKKQMLCLLDSQNLRGFVDATVDPPEIKSPNIMKQYNSLVEGWIYGSLDEYMLKALAYIEGPRSIWSALKTICDPQEAPKGSGSSSTESHKGGDVSDQPINEEEGGDVSDQPINEEELRYRYASNVNVSNFVSMSLLTKSNYTTWRKQMLCLLDSENLRGFVDEAVDPPEIKRPDIHTKYENLVGGWIRSSVGDDIRWRCYGNPRFVWQQVKRLCDPQAAPIDDGLGHTALKAAYISKSLHTFLYLWEAVNDEQGKPEAINRDEDEIRRNIDFGILEDAISKQQYGIASRLVNIYPQVAMQDDRLFMALIRTFPSDLGFGEALIRPSLKNFHQRIVKRSSSLFNAPKVLYIWVDHVLWATRSLKEAMWLLQETVLILLVVPAAVLYPLYQLIRLLILVILYPFFILYFLLWTVLANTGPTDEGCM